MAKRLISGLFLLLLSGIAIAIEELKYRVIELLGILELGVYNPKIIAVVEVSGTLKQASSKGFISSATIPRAVSVAAIKKSA